MKTSTFLVSVLAVITLVAGGCAATVPEEEGTEPGEVMLTPEDALDVAVGWLQDEYPDRAPQSGTNWQVEEVEMTGPGGEPVVGASAKRIVSDDWVAMVTWQVVAPEHMQYRIVLKSPASGWYWQGTVKAADGEVAEQTPMQQINEEMSREIAEEFVRNSPTFAFDGMPETLELVETLYPDIEGAWGFVYRFESRHAGYGDRTGQALAQVITPHEAHITVERGEVISALMDEKWDMLAQEML
ncbi:MAG: hypothetical protein ACOC6A_06115 [Chloroflexota bacterium]